MHKNWVLFKIYFMAGAFTFSGGLAMLPVIEKEFSKEGWLDKETLYDDAAVAQTLPGVIAITNACIVGKRINGVPGMLSASFGAILPAFALMSLATYFYQMLPQEGPILTALTCIRATSAAFLFAAAFTVARFNLKTPLLKGLALFAFVSAFFQLLSTPWIIVIAAIVGLFFYKGGKK